MMMTRIYSLVSSIIAVAIILSSVTLAVAQERKAIPRTANGKPDFSGVWAGPAFSHKVGPGDTDSPAVTLFDRKKMAPFQPGGEAFMIRKISGDVLRDDPTALCLPNGLTRQILSPYPQQFVQTPGQIAILYEYMHFFRVIPTDGRSHNKDIDSPWMGDSVGRWEGDTLMIDTVGVKEWMLDATIQQDREGVWHSDQLHVIERLRYIDPVTVSYQITIDDPLIFMASWSQDFQMRLHPSWKLLEFVCEENNRCQFGKCVDSDVQKNNPK